MMPLDMTIVALSIVRPANRDNLRSFYRETARLSALRLSAGPIRRLPIDMIVSTTISKRRRGFLNLIRELLVGEKLARQRDIRLVTLLRNVKPEPIIKRDKF